MLIRQLEILLIDAYPHFVGWHTTTGIFGVINKSHRSMVLRSYDNPNCRLLYALGSFAELEAAILILMQLSVDSARTLAFSV
jgi:hypothetical protein